MVQNINRAKAFDSASNYYIKQILQQKNNRQNPGVIALHRKTSKFQEFYIISSLSSILNYNMLYTHIQNQQVHINKLYFLCTVQTTHIKKDNFCQKIQTHTYTYIKLQTQEISWRFHHEVLCSSVALYLVPESDLMAICYLIPK